MDWGKQRWVGNTQTIESQDRTKRQGRLSLLSACLLELDVDLLLPSGLLFSRPSDRDWDLYQHLSGFRPPQCTTVFAGSPVYRWKVMRLLMAHNGVRPPLVINLLDLLVLFFQRTTTNTSPSDWGNYGQLWAYIILSCSPSFPVLWSMIFSLLLPWNHTCRGSIAMWDFACVF